MLSLMFTQALSSQLFKFSQTANLNKILNTHCFLTSSSLSYLRSNISHQTSVLLAYLMPIFPQLCNNQTVLSISQYRWKIIDWLYSNSISYLSICDQYGCESFHQERYRSIYECFGAGTCSKQSVLVKSVDDSLKTQQFLEICLILQGKIIILYIW